MNNMNQLEVNYTHVNMYMHTYTAGTAVCPDGFFSFELRMSLH